jgi:hypothetical protein
MELPLVNAHTPDWLHHRMTASKNILDAMTGEEKDQLHQDGKMLRANGFSVDKQRK